MPTPGPIRKEILSALKEFIIPSLWRQAASLGCVSPPWRFHTGINVRLIAKTLPRACSEKTEFPIQARWPGAKLHSGYYPYCGFIYAGAADERTLITAAQAKKYELSPGIYALRWQAPGLLLFPSGTPRNAGDTEFWQGSEPPPMRKILWFSLGPEILMHTHRRDTGGTIQISHSLQVSDPTALSLANLFIRELQGSAAGEQDIARAMLLALMLRLQQELSAGRVKIANTSRSPLPSPETMLMSEHPSLIARDTAIYIQMHLHEPLTLPGIAGQVSLSATHLNRLFRRFYGVSVMRYVREQRIAAAKNILEEGPENIAEIAALVGFKRASAFCDVFRRETGLSPRQFRHARRAKRTSTE